MKVCVVGTGYVGLVSGACLAEKGHDVVCVDVDEAKIALINQGIPPIYEAGLETMLRNNVGGRLRATSDLRSAVLGSEISLIAVGTPFKGDEIDLCYVDQVARQIGEVLRDHPDYHVVVVKSTVVPGTTDERVLSALEAASGKKAGVDFGVGMNPEFLKEGDAISDFMNPDRIVMGGIDGRSLAKLRQLYAVFAGVDVLETNCKTAEMIKYTANALLATMISFANEIANLCSAIGGVDVTEVTRGVHLDKRLSPILPVGDRVVPGLTTYIEAGCGYGGSCFPKDVKALNAFGARKGMPMRLLNAVIDINSVQYQQVLARLYKHYDNLQGLRIAVLGLAFKPGTDDMRESPAIPIMQELLSRSARIKAFDPVAMKEAKRIFQNQPIDYCLTLADTVSNVDVVLVLTRWEEFKALPGLIEKASDPPLVIDGRRMLDKNSIARYEGIGL